MKDGRKPPQLTANATHIRTRGDTASPPVLSPANLPRIIEPRHGAPMGRLLHHREKEREAEPPGLGGWYNTDSQDPIQRGLGYSLDI